MKYISQLAIIMVISLLGEVLNMTLPLPVPGSIYGFVIMLLSLRFKLIKLEDVKEVGNFLLDNMSIMFVPAIVGLIVIWKDISKDILNIFVISVLTTIIVMVATGKMTELILRKDGAKDERDN